MNAAVHPRTSPSSTMTIQMKMGCLMMRSSRVTTSFAGKACAVHYIARVGAMLDDEYEGIFFQKVLGRSDERVISVRNEDDTASFAVENIVQSLPKPRPVGGSARLSNQLNFKCSLDKWNLK